MSESAMDLKPGQQVMVWDRELSKSVRVTVVSATDKTVLVKSIIYGGTKRVRRSALRPDV